MKIRYFKFLTSALLALALLCAACSDGGGKVSVEIGPDGGIVVSEDGRVTLSIPAGALSSITEISIEESDLSELPPEFSDLDPAPEKVYALAPDGLAFALPATASVTLDSTPVAADGSLQGDAALLFTSTQGMPEILANSTITINAAASEISISGEITHFSPLVQTGLIGFKAVVSGVPDSLPVGASFSAVVAITNNPSVTHRKYLSDPEPRYFNDSTLPIRPDFPNSSLFAFNPVPIVVNDDNLQLAQASFPYTCVDAGVGNYKSSVIPFVSFFSFSEPDLKSLGIQFIFEKKVVCGNVPQPTPNPSGTPSPSPTAGGGPCAKEGLYSSPGASCGITSFSISKFSGEGNAIINGFGSNPGTLTFNKTADPNTFQSAQTEIIIRNVKGHSCMLTCGPGANQLTLKCTRPGAACSDVFTLQ